MMKFKISNLELSVIFYIALLFIFDFLWLGFINLSAYIMFNLLEIIDIINTL
jgi:hypothetical protein